MYALLYYNDLSIGIGVILVCPQCLDLRSAEEVEYNFVGVKLEGGSEVEGEEVVCDDCVDDALDELDACELPFEDILFVFVCDGCRRALLCLFLLSGFQQFVLP